ncbi:MAG TPA: hypothetical protein VF232_01235 [Gaiellaceae bacterium]
MARGICIAAAFSTSALLAVLLPTGAFGDGKPGYGCPPGFNLGALTFDEWIALPRTQAAIEAGLTTADDVRAGLAASDKNGNGMVCAQLSHGFEVNNRPLGQYFYNLSDDNASKPS